MKCGKPFESINRFCDEQGPTSSASTGRQCCITWSSLQSKKRRRCEMSQVRRAEQNARARRHQGQGFLTGCAGRVQRKGHRQEEDDRQLHGALLVGPSEQLRSPRGLFTPSGRSSSPGTTAPRFPSEGKWYQRRGRCYTSWSLRGRSVARGGAAM